MDRARRRPIIPILDVRLDLEPARSHAPGLLVLQTYAVDGPRGTGIAYYELHLAPDVAADAPRTIVLTRDPALYARALHAESTLRRVEARWHASRRPNGTYCQLLDALEERSDP
jgi:hypothetical protein